MTRKRRIEVSREQSYALLSDMLDADPHSTPTSRRLARLIVRCDVQEAWPVSVFVTHMDADDLCARALVTRDCPVAHEWVPTPVDGLWLPFGVGRHPQPSVADLQEQRAFDSASEAAVFAEAAATLVGDLYVEHNAAFGDEHSQLCPFC